MRRVLLLAAGLAATVCIRPAVAADPPPTSSSAVEFFESKVRPVLAEHCFGCHGEKKQQAGLRLDTPEGMAKGSDGGPVVAPGDPARSTLIKAVRRDGDSPMPPKAALPADAVAALSEWVKMGAPYPAKAVPTQLDPKAAAAKHWAYQPVKDPPAPATKADPGPNPLDWFVLARLEARGLTLAPKADRRVLIRRAYFDLVGLPPTADEVEAFAADPDPMAFEKLVDKLLASPHYGERWGRHWLDLARYADSKGYVFTEERAYPYAYTYRDYVIRSFNEDKPYDRFVTEQLAADKLDLGADNRPLAALGFLTVGRRFMNNTHDIIDDRIDVVTRGLMGLTVTCARCHDHKYDPVPAADYYSLYGVFAGTVEPKDPPVIGDPTAPTVKQFEEELAKKQKAAADFQAQMYADALAKFRSADGVAAYLAAARDARGLSQTDVDMLAAGRKLDANMLNRWREYLGAEPRKRDPVFLPWQAVWDLPDADFPAKAPAALDKVLKADARPAVPAPLAAALRAARPTPADFVAAYGKALAEAAKPPAGEKGDAALAAALLGPDAPTNPPPEFADKFVAITVKKQFRLLRNDADKFKATSPLAPAKAMAVADAPKPFDAYVFLRGNPANHGPSVPRQMVGVVAGPDRKPFTGVSGRLDLARAIASPSNPLTARVLVNRVWGHHFGRPLVRTPSDFGVRSDPPTHPELLDWLATRFVADGWSVKQLHRRIMLSAAYQQSSAVPEEVVKADPENQLLGRYDRRRRDFESLRDGMLAAGGTLDPAVYGRSVDLFARPYPTRRTVYAAIDRQNLPGTFRAFDFASPDGHTPQRFLTTVPQQALFLMNSPFVADQAKAVCGRPEVAFAAGDRKVRAIYRAVLGRDPTAEEAGLARAFAADVGGAAPAAGQLGRWELLAQVLLLSNEFAFVD